MYKHNNVKIIPGIALDDARNPVISIEQHPIDVMEPLPPLASENEVELAVAVKLIAYLFPTEDLNDTMHRVVCLAHQVLPDLYNLRKKIDVAAYLGVSPQAINQTMERARKALLPTPTSPANDVKAVQEEFNL